MYNIILPISIYRPIIFQLKALIFDLNKTILAMAMRGLNSLNLCTLIMLIIFAPTIAAATDKTYADNTTYMADHLQYEFPDAPITITDSTIDSSIKSYSLFVLDCWEEGCNPCQLISPTIDRMAQDFKDKIVFGKLLTDQNHKTRVKYHIYHYPMLLIFKNGSLVYKHLGNYPKDTLESIILSKLSIS